MRYTLTIDVPHIGRLRAFLKRLWRAYGIRVVEITEANTPTTADAEHTGHLQ